MCVGSLTLRLVSTLPPTQSRLATVAKPPGARADPPPGHLSGRAAAHLRTYARTHAHRPPSPPPLWCASYQARGHVGPSRDGWRGKPRESGPRGA